MSIYMVGSYLVHLTVGLAVTVMVAHSLKKNGRAFWWMLFTGNTGMADSVNHLLVLGVMHFGNLYMFHRLRNRGSARRFGQAPSGGWDDPHSKMLE